MKNITALKNFLSVAVIFTILMWIPGTALAQEARLTDDTYISSSNRTTNFGGAGTMSVNGNNSNLRGFIKFDLSTLPAGTTGNSVAKAVLTLYVSNVGKTGSFNVQVVNGSWNELTITNATAPTLGAVVATAVPVTTDDSFVSVDVTTAVKNWLNGTVASNGLALVANTSASSFSFDTKEATNTSHPASLEIALIGPAGPQGTAGLQGPQGLTGFTGATGAAGAT